MLGFAFILTFDDEITLTFVEAVCDQGRLKTELFVSSGVELSQLPKWGLQSPNQELCQINML